MPTPSAPHKSGRGGARPGSGPKPRLTTRTTLRIAPELASRVKAKATTLDQPAARTYERAIELGLLLL